MCAARGADRPEELETRMNGSDFRRWIEYYQYKNGLLERIEWQIAQLASLMAWIFKGLDTSPEEWIPSPESAAPETDAVHLSDRELMMQLALGMGAEIRYQEKGE